MPFFYDVPIPKQEGLPEAYVLREWLRSVGDEVHDGTPTAILEANNYRYVLATAGPGFLRRHVMVVGAALRAGEVVAQVDANGEDIPYERAYASLRPA